MEAGKVRSLSHSITRILTQSPFKVVKEILGSGGSASEPSKSVFCAMFKEFGKEDPQLENVF